MGGSVKPMSDRWVRGEPPWDVIWKFAIPAEDDFRLQLPGGSLPLSVGIQAEEPVLWAAVWKAAPLVSHRFHLRGTGHPLGEAAFARFVGTFQLAASGLVFHLFDGGQETER